jgi:hypothetical protein
VAKTAAKILAVVRRTRHDDFMIRIRHLALFALLFWSPGARGQTANPAIVQATAAMQAAVPRAQADPAHPIFHVTSPATAPFFTTAITTCFIN